VTVLRAAGGWLVMALCVVSAAVHAQGDAPALRRAQGDAPAPRRAQGDASALRGSQLYDGRIALTGQLRGHDQPLPADALRCTNCHEPSRLLPREAGTASSTDSFAPRLDQHSLTQFHARRGGPATRYDADAFCRVLHSSVDPGLVLLRKPMPQYTLSDDDCQALWLFLSQRPAVPTP
jgi:hypothetical protein